VVTTKSRPTTKIQFSHIIEDLSLEIAFGYPPLAVRRGAEKKAHGKLYDQMASTNRLKGLIVSPISEMKKKDRIRGSRKPWR